ncbi:bacterio-opsin activator [Haloarcula hispanica N601]|uniref:Bacterio-opsin activator n=2 Tax=Haloarcula hispanica TaxID=51589 RepID=A0A482TAV6_HALHI|nr:MULTISPECIES: helix-turn-helix domain-containing protein [Haloarcula]AHB65143.1 bacterio-opsin activator [Haloarcula hispanica N601]AJF26294.1 bacterio-opsin activator [Haloarcula sp. CBA1115]KAA9407890.1 bacterio-opsin activator [Haloarcula sp. CBA1131]KAA9409064.1 bacterio-opsin activator [Haloarcula hispanica]KZX48008.1 bacterio-opsin activator [Haloarcula sp. K1]
MSDSGIRVELSVDTPGACPVASVSDEAGAAVTDVARSSPDEDGQVIEEFTATGTDEGAIEAREDMDKVFATGNGSRYQFSRSRTECVCEAVETYDCPVADIRAEGGQLHLTFHAPDVDRVRAIVTRLKELYDGVSLRSMRRNGDVDPVDSILVDRSKLTDRQQEVLETAVEMGYFEYPKGANAGDVASELDISVSTFAEHLAAAQTKLLDSIIAE